MMDLLEAARTGENLFCGQDLFIIIIILRFLLTTAFLVVLGL